jgi:molybdopterin/thiamine biosynthesis adenylyltransferase
MKRYLTADARAALHDLADAARTSGREEHAYLMGRTIRGKLVVRHVVPTPNAFAGPAIVRPDEQLAQHVLAPYAAAGNQLLGSAHVHFGLRGPSRGDEATLRTISADFPGYLCIVVTITGEHTSMTCHSIDGGLVEHDLVGYEYDTTIPEKRVLVLGAGSGASTVLLQLASWGVPFTILDNDRLEERNLRRHLLDRRSLGKPKAVALRRLLQPRTSARITALVEQLTPERHDRLAQLIAAHDLTVDCTGDVRIAHLTSQVARDHRKTTVHAGVFVRGSGGYVFLSRAQGACIGCLHHLPRIEPQDNASLQHLANQYGFSEDEISAQAGLFTDIGVVSALQAKVALEALRSDTSDLPNLYLVNNTEIAITRHEIAPSRECLTCNPNLLEEQ